jgi:hypothetical protein
VLSLILTHITYGNIVFAGDDAASLSRVEVAFTACLRYIYIYIYESLIMFLIWS